MYSAFVELVETSSWTFGQPRHWSVIYDKLHSFLLSFSLDDLPGLNPQWPSKGVEAMMKTNFSVSRVCAIPHHSLG